MSAELREFTSHAPAGADAVKLLEQALVLAKAGELGGVAIAFVDRLGQTNSAWSRSDAMGTLIGSVARLQHDMLMTGYTEA